MRRLVILAGVALATGCESGQGTLTLAFPNAESRSAIQRLRVDFVRGSAVTRPCADFSSTAAELPLVSEVFEAACPRDADGACVSGWLDDVTIPSVPTDAPTVQVRGYPVADDDAWPLVAACAEGFDVASPDVRMDLELFLLPGTRLEVVSGPAMVGTPGATSPRPLEVRVRSFPPEGSTRSFLDLPGVDVRVEIVSGDASWTGFGSGQEGRLVTGADGRAAASYLLGAVGTSEVRATIVGRDEDAGASASAFLSARTELSRPVVSDVGVVDGRPHAITLGDVDGDGRSDALILACDPSTGPCEVADDAAPDGTFGTSLLGVVAALELGGRAGPSTRELGWAPAGVVATDLNGDGADEVLVLESRNSACVPESCPPNAPCVCRREGRRCPCEGSVLHTLAATENGFEVFAPPRTTTASNAVGLVPGLGLFDEASVIIAHRGRVSHRQSCARATACPQDCPVGEVCGTVSGALRCLDPQPTASVFRFRSGAWFDPVQCGCLQNLDASCPPEWTPPAGACSGRSWTRIDACGRRVLDRVPSGSAGIIPRRVGAGVVRSSDRVDLVVGSDRTLELVTLDEAGADSPESILVDDDVRGVVPLRLDPRLDERVPLLPIDFGRPRGDLIWWSAGACPDAPLRCPVVGRLESGAQGCVGVVATAGAPDVAALDYGSAANCRRFDLSQRPDHGCEGDFDGDGALDLALASEQASELAVALGDGFGGLQWPPQAILLPSNGGPVVCGDVDRDGRDEVVLVSASTGEVRVVRAQP